MKNLLIILLSLLLSISTAQAACNFIINIGDNPTKISEKFAPPLPMFPGQFMLPVQSTEVCPNDKLNEDIAVEYVFLGETDETAKLAAIRMVVMNDEKNTESNKLTLMNYAKKVYGDFDTGENPKIFNRYNIWETSQSITIYKRMYNSEGIIDEEIYITNIEYDQKLGEFYNKLEADDSKLDEETN